MHAHNFAHCGVHVDTITFALYTLNPCHHTTQGLLLYTSSKWPTLIEAVEGKGMCAYRYMYICTGTGTFALPPSAMASPTTTTKGKGASATKKMVGGMKELWQMAKKDFTENSRELKQDFIGIFEAAKIKRPAPKDPKLPASLLIHQAVNEDVGGELLTKYKEEWSLIHRQTEEASQASATLSSDLTEMHRSIHHTHSIISACCMEFKQLPEVVQAIETTREKVQELGGLLGKLEESIAEYSRVRAELEAVRRKGSLKIQYDKQSGKMERELQRLQEVLTEELRLKEGTEKEIESEKVAERQQTFQDMFQQQMADYRETGSIERAIGGRSGASQLEDVTIEDTDGTASLNEFLSDVDDVMPSEESDRSRDTDDDETPGEASHDPGNQSRDIPTGDREESVSSPMS